MNMFEKMFCKVGKDMCRLTTGGPIAVKTTNGYKAYNVNKKRLTNVGSFTIDVGSDLFFTVPTNKVKIGDIIIINDKPKCVISVEDTTVTVLDYENSMIEQSVPERHIFMGNTYFYSKIVSMFGNNFGQGAGTKNMMKYMLMSEMCKQTNGSNTMSNMLPMMLMGNMCDVDGMFGEMFGEMFSDDSDSTDAAGLE